MNGATTDDLTDSTDEAIRLADWAMKKCVCVADAGAQMNLILLFVDQAIRKYMSLDLPCFNLASGDPGCPDFIQCIADFLDGDVFVLEASENGRGYAITAHYSSSSENEGYKRAEYFFIRLYGQYWGSAKPRDFNDDDLSEAALKRIESVVQAI